MHVYNRDILTSSVAAAVAGLITSFAQFLHVLRRRRRPGPGGNPLAALALAILAPFAAMLVQMAISRTREFDADEDGARLTGDPLALASALRKLEHGTQRAPLPQDRDLVDVSHLMIANPFRGAGMGRMFATHPPDGRPDRASRADGRRPVRHRPARLRPAGQPAPVLSSSAATRPPTPRGPPSLPGAGGGGVLAVVDELQRDVEVGALEQRDHGLQVVAALARRRASRRR